VTLATPRAVRGATDASELDRIGEEIATLAAHVHAATYRLLVLLAEFDERGGWGGGFRSCAHWLSWRTGIAPGAAREKVRTARALRTLPRVSEAMRAGELSFAKVRAITRVATPDNETDLLEVARSGTAAQVERIVRAWHRADRLEEQRAEGKRHESRQLSLYIDEDGMYVVRGRLDPEAGALLEKALESAGEALFGRRPESRAESGSQSRQASHAESGSKSRQTSHADSHSESTSAGQRRADAVGLVAERALAVRDAGKVRSAFEVVVHVDAEALRRDSAAAMRQDSAPRQDSAAVRQDSAAGQSVIAGGARVSAETSRRLACDAGRRVMSYDENGSTLDVGRRNRTVPAAIRRALEHRDRRCRFPGCDLRYCDAHHIVHWADGGATALANLVLLCRRHHRAVHEAGFRIERDAAGDLRFHHPNGRVIPDVPAAPRLQADLASRHAGRGIAINSEALIAFSTGQPLDVNHAIVTLRGG
jgi:hypothetical protein